MQHRWDPSTGWGQIEFLPGYVKLGSSTFKTPSIYQGLLVYLHFHIPKWINTHILLSNLPQSFWGNNYNYTVVLQSETFWCLFLQGFLMHIWSHESAWVCLQIRASQNPQISFKTWRISKDFGGPCNSLGSRYTQIYEDPETMSPAPPSMWATGVEQS